MKKKLIVILIVISSIQLLKAQQIGDGWEQTVADFSQVLSSGGYSYPSPLAGVPDTDHPWQHLFVLRHQNSANNHQFQIGASYAVNDRLFFRKIAVGDLSQVNTQWNELATRGANSFTGIISSSEVIYSTKDGYAPTYLKSWGLSGTGDIYIESAASQNLFLTDSWSRTGMLNIQFAKTVFESGNVLIGKTTQDNPAYKLDVAGSIRANEIKVNTTGADFVFEPSYKLRTLAEVENFIKLNKHLPDVAPATEMQINGVSMGEMQAKLLQKVEELTLYTIEQDKKNGKLQQELAEQKAQYQQLLNEVKELKTLIKK